ncbi:MAG: hypothetical protein HY801_10045 [Candidatus Lindowbacteria bacterium]|nr:hypothetical protein [Candidatus Lindowbacteria bacterium]
MSPKQKKNSSLVVRLIAKAGFHTCIILFLALFSHTKTALAEDTNKDGWIDLPFDVSGRYEVDYWGRWNTDDAEDDHQLFQYLNLRVDNIVPDKLSLHFSGRLSAELDGNDEANDFFADIYDTFEHSANGRIYYLYLDVKDPLFKDSDLKLGRQYSYEPKSVLFNGAKYEQSVNKLRFYLQGGIRGTNYTSPEEDDTIGGVGVDYQLLPRTTVGYDYLRVVDDFLDDDYHSFDILQKFGNLRTYAQFSILNDDADELNLFGSYYHAPFDLNVTARYYSLLTQRDQLTNEFSSLVDVGSFDVDDPQTLGVYFPFHLVNLNTYKGWWNKFGTSAGIETRWMDDNDERNDFNREYDRYFFTIEMWDFFLNGLTTSLSFEYWDVDASEDSISVGIDADKDITDRLNVGAGYYFSRYRIRATFNDTTFSDEIRTPSFYGKLKYKVKENVAVLAKYQFEDNDDLGINHELFLSCSIDF